MDNYIHTQNPRVLIIQKLYSQYLNKDSKIIFPKHKYRKFIKDVVIGTIERKEFIQDFIDKELKNYLNKNKSDLIIKLIIMASIYEFMFMHRIPIKVVITEYLRVSDFFVETSQKSFLNAILDKASKLCRIKTDWIGVK